MASSALSEEVAAKVRQQVEFYFSDSNLPNDNFLLRAVQKTEEGFVSLAVVSSFAKMKNHLGLPQDTNPDTISRDVVAAVAEALKSSSALKVSEDGSSVARSTKLSKPDEARAELYARSVAVSPFPYNVTKEEIEKFFEEHSKPYSVRLPRHSGSNMFGGYAVIELSSPEEVQRVSGLTVSFKGADLKFQSRESFDKDFYSRKHSKSNEPFYTKGLVVRFKLEHSPSKAGEAAAAEAKPDEEMKEATAREPAPEKKDEPETKEAPEKKDEPETKEGEPAPEKKDEPETKEGEQASEQPAETKGEPKPAGAEILREDIKAVLGQYGVVKYVDYSKGQTSGCIRFETTEEANKARTAAVVAEAGGLVVKDWMLTLEALQGEEENEYWRNAHQAMNKYKKENQHSKKESYQHSKKESYQHSKKEIHSKRFKGGGGGGRGGRFDQRNPKRSKAQNATVTGKHVRLDDDGEDEPEAKLQRTA